MAQELHITFKAGLCEADDKNTSAPGEPRHIKPLPTPGYIYLFTEDDLLHFCWRPRATPMSEPQLDLIMFAGDASFKPYKKHGSKHSKAQTNGTSSSASPTNGRLYVLTFSSSSDRHFFWLQSKSQSPDNDPSWHSPRDLKIAEIVNKLLAGDEVDVRQEIRQFSPNGPGGGGDDDTAMEEGDGAPQSPDHHRAASGGAGAGATGGDVREEGEESREGGADGGRAATTGQSLADDPDARAAVDSFLRSFQGGAPQASSAGSSKPFTTLPDLLSTASTLPVLAGASDSLLDRLLSEVPPILILLAAGTPPDEASQPDEETVQAITMSLDAEQKREILTKVIRSPQFSQSLMTLTMALRDGGLPTISEALKVPVKNGGYVNRAGGVPIGGGDAVETFLEGVKKQAEEKKNDEGDEEM